MARNKGTFNFAANFEVLTKAPLDARLVVDTKANLIDPTIWKDVNGLVWLYQGIVVSVVQDTSDNNGLYFLIGDTVADPSSYTNPDNWLKINALSPIDSSGTASVTWQLNNGDNGVILKDASGNLEVVTFDGSTYANIKAGHLDINTIKLDTLTGTLYAQDGSIFAISGSKVLLGYNGTISGILNQYSIVHDLSTLNQVITVWDNDNQEIIYPDIVRGASTNIITFSDSSIYKEYHIIILGFC